MNFLAVILLLACSVMLAQGQRCPGRPRAPRCAGPRNEGRGGRGCGLRQMWWFDTAARSCRALSYRGCGGNSNRFCTREECVRACGGR